MQSFRHFMRQKKENTGAIANVCLQENCKKNNLCVFVKFGSFLTYEIRSHFYLPLTSSAPHPKSQLSVFDPVNFSTFIMHSHLTDFALAPISIHLSNSLLLIHIPFFATYKHTLVWLHEYDCSCKIIFISLFSTKPQSFQVEELYNIFNVPTHVCTLPSPSKERNKEEVEEKSFLYINFKDITNFLLF